MQAHTERLNNIEANIMAVKARLLLPMRQNKNSAQLVCFGPSLRKTWNKIDKNKTIVTISGAHDFLRDKGIIPAFHVEFDWRKHKARHVNDPQDTVFWLASCVHPDLVAKVQKVVLWHAEQTQQENDFIKKHEPLAYLVPGGSSAGLRAIELLYALGYRTFDIHGMDSSFEKSGWAGFHYGDHKAEIVEVPYGGRKFVTSAPFMAYADQFMHCVKLHSDCIFNMHGDGLIQTMYKMEKSA